MKPADDKTLQLIREFYAAYLNKKNTVLKSAYLAVCAAGFTNIVKSDREKVMVERESDHTFVVCSYPSVPDEIKILVEDRIVRFHTEKF